MITADTAASVPDITYAQATTAWVRMPASSDASGQQKAQALGARRGYGSYRALIDDPDVQVVHNATPNHLHAEVTLAALAAGKHVVSDKPLARTAAEAK